MVITLEYLKTIWGEGIIKFIQDYGFCIASDSFLDPKFDEVYLDLDKRVVSKVLDPMGCPAVSYIHAIWTDRHDEVMSIKKRSTRFKYIYISDICYSALEEYTTICELLNIKKIYIMTDDIEFYKRSEKLLSTIPNIDIIGVLYTFNRPVIKKVEFLEKQPKKQDSILNKNPST
jgi:hypothetical protein